MNFDWSGEGIGEGAPVLCLVRRALGDTVSACFGLEGQGRATDPGSHIVQAILLIGCAAAAVALLTYIAWARRNRPDPKAEAVST